MSCVFTKLSNSFCCNDTAAAARLLIWILKIITNTIFPSDIIVRKWAYVMILRLNSNFSMHRLSEWQFKLPSFVYIPRSVDFHRGPIEFLELINEDVPLCLSKRNCWTLITFVLTLFLIMHINSTEDIKQ